MPTPFYHLDVAEQLIAHPNLNREVRQFLERNRGAFLFGNTAPDVQVVSQQSRASTHFFDLPIKNELSNPWDSMLESYPSLVHSKNQSDRYAAFLAGYLCHLQADWIWIVDIFLPVFSNRNSWGGTSYRLYLHNVLRAYLDLQILENLPAQTDKLLRSVTPRQWLPFVRDRHLRQWRDFLWPQLSPGAGSRTVEVFANRQGVSSEEFHRLLDSEEQMEREVFIYLARQQLVDYRQRLVTENTILLERYLQDLQAGQTGYSMVGVIAP